MTPAEIEARLFRQDPEYIETVKVMALLVESAMAHPDLENLMGRIGGLLSLLLEVDDEVLQNDLMMLFTIAWEERNASDSDAASPEVH